MATHPSGRDISVLLLVTSQVIAFVASGLNPNYLVQNEVGRSISVSNAGDGTISEVDSQHWFVRRNIRVGGIPKHMLLSKGVYVNNDTGGKALAMDLASRSVAAEYEIGAEPHGIDLSPDGQTLYATS